MGLKRDANDGNAVAGEVEVAVHHIDSLREYADSLGLAWDTLSKSEKLALSQRVEPAERHTTTNASLQEYHEHLVDIHDPAQTQAHHETEYLAVGTDNTAPASTDTGLGTEVYRTDITQTEDQGTDLFVSTFLDTSEANGNTLVEVALCSDATQGSGIEFNRALINSVAKDNTKTVTINVTLQWRTA